MDSRFKAMPMAGGPSRSSASAPGLLTWATLATLNPRELTCDALHSVTTWTYTAMGQCFSRLRRVQFDEEHQRSLLSCHSTEDNYPMADDAMLELRRRVQETYRSPAHVYAVPQTSTSTRTAAAKRTNSGTRSTAKATKGNQQEPELGRRLSNAEKTLNDILGPKDQELRPEEDGASSYVKPEDLRRLSVDELLSMRVEAHRAEYVGLSRSTSSPERVATDNQEDEQVVQDTQALDDEAIALRAWLASIDPARSNDYSAYAASFEKHGFHAVTDLLHLDEQEIEMAMSEMGIVKFAHRTRIRKAILKLRARREDDGERVVTSSVSTLEESHSGSDNQDEE